MFGLTWAFGRKGLGFVSRCRRMRENPPPLHVEPRNRLCRKLHRPMGGNGTQAGAGTAPEQCVVDLRAADAQDEITGGHVHVYDGFIRALTDHAPHTRHFAHAGAEFQVALRLDEDAPRSVQAVNLPDRGIFHRMIIVQGKRLARHKGHHEQRFAPLYGRDVKFEPTGSQDRAEKSQNEHQYRRDDPSPGGRASHR